MSPAFKVMLQRAVYSIALASHLTPHTSHLTRHTSHVTPHTSHLTLCSTLTKVTTSTPPFSLLKCSGCRSNHTVSLNLWWRRFMHARPLVRPLETKPQTPYQISSNHRRSITRRSWAKGKQGPIFERMSRNLFEPISRNPFVQVKYNQAPKSRFFVADVLGISWHKVGHSCLVFEP